jgi:outer membrane immunogenic protein
MRKFGRFSSALTGLALLALPAAAAAAPFTWTGFYIGGTAGVGFGGDSTSIDLDGFNYFAANPVPGEVTKLGTDSAFIGGGEVGYNAAFDNLVAGIEPISQGSNSSLPRFRRAQ